MGYVEEYLKFVKDSFNTESSTSGDDLLGNLKELVSYSDRLGKYQAKRKEDWKAKKLIADYPKDPEKILNESKLDTEVNKLVTSIESLDGINVYMACDSLVRGLTTTRKWLEDYKKVVTQHKQTNKSSMDTLIVLGQSILGRAIELCPIDSGDLRRSGVVIPLEETVRIVFTAPYASYVHENMDVYHPIGQAKFLELATQEFFPDKSIWVEIHGIGVVSVELTLDGSVYYTHYDD